MVIHHLTGRDQAIILSNEVIGEIKRFPKGVEVTEETLAVDAINRVGPGGGTS